LSEQPAGMVACEDEDHYDDRDDVFGKVHADL
jgi:hypothetical protein